MIIINKYRDITSEIVNPVYVSKYIIGFSDKFRYLYFFVGNLRCFKKKCYQIVAGWQKRIEGKNNRMKNLSILYHYLRSNGRFR